MATIARKQTVKVRAKVKRVAKSARLEEAAIRSRRKGVESAHTRARQARRDEKQDAAARLASEATAVENVAVPSEGKEEVKKGKGSRSRPQSEGPLVEVRTTNNIAGSARLIAHVEALAARQLRRHADRLTRVDIHLSDENGEKSGTDDKRCQIEARPKSQKPVSVTATGKNLEQAATGALGKMNRLLESHFQRRSSR